MQETYDILIIGGGLSGGCLALALKDSGYRIAVVEAFTDTQRHASRAGDRALALSYGTVCLLRALRLWEPLQDLGAPIRDIHISARGHFGKTRLSARDHGVEALGYVITARALEDAIAAALDRASVERICPARLTGFQSGSDAVIGTLRQHENAFDVSTRLLVGADGAESSVRRFLSIDQETRDYHQSAIVTSVRPHIDPAGVAFERFTETGPLAMLPILDRCCSVVWTQTTANADQIIALDDEDFLACLQNAFGFRLGRLKLQSKRMQFPLKLVRAKKMIGHRSVLIGNTVHQLHPVAGQGFNLGMRDIAALAEMIVNDLRSQQDPGGNALLEAYARARSQDHETVIRFIDLVVRIFSNDWLPLASARGWGLLGLDRCYPAKRALTRHAMGLGGPMPRIGDMN
ncbi:MAG: 2-octaprenyl-6-methoxyphenyl hydroxylase [Methylococcales bacterium]